MVGETGYEIVIHHYEWIRDQRENQRNDCTCYYISYRSCCRHLNIRCYYSGLHNLSHPAKVYVATRIIMKMASS